MRTLMYSFLPALLCVSVWSRDPEEIDRSSQFKQVIESARNALNQIEESNDQRLKLQASLRALQKFSTRYPEFQKDSLNVRMDAIRLRLKVLATVETKPSQPAQLPTTLALYNQMELLLLENIRLRDALYAEKENQTDAAADLTADFQEALKTVAGLQRELKTLKLASRNRLDQQAKEITYLNSELKKLASLNLELNGESERRAKAINQLQAALKTASEKTFTKEDELARLKKDAVRLNNTITRLNGENEDAHRIIESLKAGTAEVLKKKYKETRLALLRQAELIGKERDAAAAAKEKMVTAQKALDVLQIQNSRLRETVKLYRQGSDNVIIQELENTVSAYKEKLAAATSASDIAQKQLSEWKAINLELLRSLNASSSKPQGAPEADLRKQIDVQHKLIEQLRTAIRQRESENEQLKATLAEKPAVTTAATNTNQGTPSALTDEQKQEVQLLVQQGKAAVVMGNLLQAKSFLEKAIALDPENDEPRRYMAELCLKQNDISGAQKYTATLGITPMTLQLQTAIHKKTNDTDAYLAQLLKAVAQEPENPAIRLITSQNLRRTRYYKLAEYQLNELWKRTPDSFDCAREYYFLYVSMGLEYTNLQKKWYNKALEINSQRRDELIFEE